MMIFMKTSFVIGQPVYEVILTVQVQSQAINIIYTALQVIYGQSGLQKGTVTRDKL